MTSESKALLGVVGLCIVAVVLFWYLFAPLVDGIVDGLPEAPRDWPCAVETAPGQYVTPSAVPSPRCTLVP